MIDIIYRAKVNFKNEIHKFHWGYTKSNVTGCFESEWQLKSSISRSYTRGTQYEIWKFHVGLLNESTDYFQPEIVFKKTLSTGIAKYMSPHTNYLESGTEHIFFGDLF